MDILEWKILMNIAISLLKSLIKIYKKNIIFRF